MILKYTIFVLLAILSNLFCQYLILSVYNGLFSLHIAMFSGTLIAMIFKYVLDKKYIFSYVPENKKEDGIKFIKYMFMGILTTLIYWCFEWSFDYYFKSDYSKYFGAFIGLSIGYFIKYLLDKKFVFK